VIPNAQITRQPLSGAEVRGIIEKKYQKTVLLDTLDQILRRGRPVRLCAAVSTEDSGSQVPGQAMRDYFAMLFEIVSGIPVHFAFNINEMGYRNQRRRERSCVLFAANMMGAPSRILTFSQKMVNLMCYFLGASNSVRSREFPRK
jgi:hypothetical protein